jgi:hypothetical protein
MTVTADQFRSSFPAFTSTTQFSDGMVNMWINFAYAELNPRAFGPNIDMYAQNMVAHYLTLQALQNAEGENGAPSGHAVGPVTGKSVGELSMQYAGASNTDPDARHWEQTVYGSFVRRGLRLYGAAPYATPLAPTPIGQGYGVPWNGPQFENITSP